MLSIFKRNFILHINKFQRSLIYPVLVPCFIGCMMLLLFLDYLYLDTGAKFFDDEFMALKIITVAGVFVIALMFLFISVCVYFVSNRLLGPHERILRELDAVIAGEKKGPLSARKQDRLFLELLKRINALIGKIQ